ncbi:MAG: hypothetical protein AAGE52_38640 [Myxococcota bacterium]
MGTLTTLVKERNLHVSKELFDIAQAAAENPSTATFFLAEIWHQLDAKKRFTFSLFDGMSFFGYRSQARDVFLTTLERCMSGTRGRGVAHFDVEGGEGVLTLDYKTKTLEVTLDGKLETWTRRPLPKKVSAALSKSTSKKKTTGKPRLRLGASFEFIKGKESVVLYYFKSSLVRLRRSGRQKYYRMVNEHLIGISGRDRTRERIAALERQGFAFAGERRVPARSIAPQTTFRTHRAGEAPPPPSKTLVALRKDLRTAKARLQYRPKWIEGAERTIRRLERALRANDKKRASKARTKERASIQGKLRREKARLRELEAQDPKQLERDVRALERAIQKES